MVSTDASIVSQVAFKGAVELVVAEVGANSNTDPNWAKERVEDLTIVFAEAITLASQSAALNEAFATTPAPQAAPDVRRPAGQASKPQSRPGPRQGGGGGGGKGGGGKVVAEGIKVLKFDDAIGDTGIDALDGLSACPKCDNDAVWDNRTTHPHFDSTSDGSPRRPYFRCAEKSCGEGFWPNESD